MSSRLVLPPTAQGVMWWAWHQLADAPHPTQALSRPIRAIRWAALAIRRDLPRSKGCDTPRKMAGSISA